MSNTMNTTEQNTSPNDVSATTKPLSGNTELLQQVQINDTPFMAVRLEDKWFLTMGKYRLTNQLGSLEECKAEATDASWNRILQIMQIMIEENNNTLKEENRVLKEQAEGLKKQIH